MNERPSHPVSARAVARLVAGIVLVVAAALLVRAAGITSVDELQSVADEAGAWSMLLFVAAYVALTVALVPGSIPSVAAGIAFGTTTGSVLVWIAATLGATAAFLIARASGRPITRQAGFRTLDRIDAVLQRRGRTGVLIVRMIPLVPFNASNYAFGLTSVTLPAYVAGTAVGIIPGVVVRVAFGESLLDIGSERFWWSASILLTVSILTSAIALHLHALRKDQP